MPPMRAAEDSVRWQTAALAALLALAAGTAAAEGAREWLLGMGAAVQALNYSGVLVYQHDGRLEVMRLLHRVDEEGEHERILSLNGPPREVIRDPRKVTCILPDARAVVVEKRRPGRSFPGVLPLDLARIERHYALELEGSDRIAGRRARVVLVRARDGYRYGYRFWVDEATRLPLKFEVLDEQGRPVEQMMFTQVDIGIDIPAAALRPAQDAAGFTWYAGKDGSGEGSSSSSLPEAGQWVVTRMPPGFEVRRHDLRRLPMSTFLVEHFMLSDGLASVSVYVDRPDSEEGFMEGLTRMGAMSAYGAVIQGYQVTAVGEVPPATVELVARHVRRVQEARP